MDFISQILNAIINVHPWHSLTVHFPIALFGTAVLFVFLALWKRNEVFERVAFYNIVVATLGTILAGATGYRDHLVRYEGETQYANTKIFLAFTLLMVSAITVFVRWRKPELLWKPSSMILYVSAYVICFSLAGLLGFIGGVILYGF